MGHGNECRMIFMYNHPRNVPELFRCIWFFLDGSRRTARGPWFPCHQHAFSRLENSRDRLEKAGMFAETTRQLTSLLIVLVSASRTAFAIMRAGMNQSMRGADKK